MLFPVNSLLIPMTESADTQAAWVSIDVTPSGTVRHTTTLRERIFKVLLLDSGLPVHVIAHRAKASVDDTAKILRGMIAEGAVFKRKPGTSTYYQYYLLEGYFEPPTPVELKIPQSAETLHRLTLIKRMKERLCEEHHYLLNAVIKDYENTLIEEDVDD